MAIVIKICEEWTLASHIGGPEFVSQVHFKFQLPANTSPGSTGNDSGEFLAPTWNSGQNKTTD